ncbi:anti-sigma factor family protein [Ramlibacter alkalitolerans]|uniref:Anti-sigma factor n=1 Tax=Ramlibacter alkalitolerans TaxID=2039631 RepID=A0ABS1JM46_9BURK|nr:anti-sigma factor [Ramlibacter alkalitolerans]MBL0425307.1 anti-sigma factor [Ramlibacter alkalitolerans]
MHADSENRQLNAYVDGELDLATHLRFEERLKLDADLRREVEAVQQLSQSLRSEADYHAAPDALRRRIAVLAGVRAAAAGDARPQWQARWRRTLATWLALRPLATGVVLATVATIAVNALMLRAGDDERLQQELVASHVRATMAQRSIDVASSDQHTVKPWFATQLDYSPPVRPLDVPGTSILGGRVDYVEGRRVAVIVYQHGKHLVDHYIWPTRQGDAPVKVAVVNGIRIAQWTRSGMAHRLVSDLDPHELQLIVQACRREEGKG